MRSAGRRARIVFSGVLEPGTVELLQTAAQLASGEPTDYGLGWFVRRVPLDDTEARVIGHGGSAVGGSTSFMAFPDHTS